jgi:hypothetical protein
VRSPSAPSPVPVEPAELLSDWLPALALRARRRAIPAQLLERGLALELVQVLEARRVEHASLDRGGDRAAGLPGMAAILAGIRGSEAATQQGFARTESWYRRNWYAAGLAFWALWTEGGVKTFHLTHAA